jgi:hypothetical protein
MTHPDCFGGAGGLFRSYFCSGTQKSTGEDARALHVLTSQQNKMGWLPIVDPKGGGLLKWELTRNEDPKGTKYVCQCCLWQDRCNQSAQK